MGNENPWKPEDERKHAASVLEWWAVESFFKSVEDNTKWSLKAVFTDWFESPNDFGSKFNLVLFDQSKNKHICYHSRNDGKNLGVLSDRFYVSYKDCYILGSYPNYSMFLHDKNNNIQIQMNYCAESLPHWVAEEITKGWLPMGFGFYRYGYIPKNRLTGIMIIEDQKFTIEGVGYFEHVWGNFLYDKPLSNIRGLTKTVPLYLKFIFGWLKNHSIKIPDSIALSSENNIFGYDWAWFLLDNGWTLFYGNTLAWFIEGPALGILILSKDGTRYQEFYDITFHYNATHQSENYDFYYPTDIDLTAKKGMETLCLKFKMTGAIHEYVSRFKKNTYWQGLVICEAPGAVEGYYHDRDTKIKISGFGKIEPQRQVSIFGHNMLKIKFLKPPRSFGASIELESYFLKKKLFTKLVIAPHPEIKIDFKKINFHKPS